MRPTRLIVCPTAANSFTLTRAREDGLWQGSRRLRVSSEPVSGIRNQAIGRILFELFFTLHAREGRDENPPPLLAVCRRGVRNGIR
jgi:hypothetical protein